MITLQILFKSNGFVVVLVFETKYHMKFDTDNDVAVATCMSAYVAITLWNLIKKVNETVSLMATTASNQKS